MHVKKLMETFKSGSKVDTKASLSLRMMNAYKEFIECSDKFQALQQADQADIEARVKGHKDDMDAANARMASLGKTAP